MLAHIPAPVLDAYRKVMKEGLANLPVTPAAATVLVSAPWMTTIRYDMKTDTDPALQDRYAGAGALIGPQHVLTAGHLFDLNLPAAPPEPGDDRILPPAPLKERDHFVRVGATGIDSGDRYEIVEVHTEFDVMLAMGGGLPERMKDIAVLVLDRPVAGIDPIPLATEPVSVGDRVSVLGWPNGPWGDGDLTQVNTAVVPREAAVFNNPCTDELSFANVPGDDHMRRGFSGAPVIRFAGHDGRVELVGVTSRGNPLDLGEGLESPGTFADAAGAHREFIDKCLAGVSA